MKDYFANVLQKTLKSVSSTNLRESGGGGLGDEHQGPSPLPPPKLQNHHQQIVSSYHGGQHFSSVSTFESSVGEIKLGFHLSETYLEVDVVSARNVRVRDPNTLGKQACNLECVKHSNSRNNRA